MLKERTSLAWRTALDSEYPLSKLDLLKTDLGEPSDPPGYLRISDPMSSKDMKLDNVSFKGMLVFQQCGGLFWPTER